MELEQIRENLKWLDEERRRDKTTLAALEERLNKLDENIVPVSKDIQELAGEVTRMKALLGRIDHLEESLLQQRVEAKRSIEEVEKALIKRLEETSEVQKIELRSIDESIAGLRKDISVIGELKSAMQLRIEEENRLSKGIESVRASLDDIHRSGDEYTRSYRLLENGRRQDAKRLTDLQGEVTALRKNMDEQRGKMDLTATTLRRLETRINELAMLEMERREAQSGFLEKQAKDQVERDRTWKDWQERFNTIERQATDVETGLHTLETTRRAVKRSQQELDELSKLVERRLNEITEIQRLAEERFRQEWVTFKADDQKRWTNYTLTQEEQQGELNRQFERLTNRLTNVEDSIQEMQDTLQTMNAQTEKRLQTLLAIVHDWVSSQER